MTFQTLIDCIVILLAIGGLIRFIKLVSRGACENEYIKKLKQDIEGFQSTLKDKEDLIEKLKLDRAKFYIESCNLSEKNKVLFDEVDVLKRKEIAAQERLLEVSKMIIDDRLLLLSMQTRKDDEKALAEQESEVKKRSNKKRK